LNTDTSGGKNFERLKSLQLSIQNKLARVAFPDYTIFSIFAVVIGAVVGIAAVLFHHSIAFFNRVFFEQTAEGLFFLGAAAVIVLPAIGMLIQGMMIMFSPNIAKRKGISEVIKAVALRGGNIPFRTTLFHFLAPVICIGSGGTLGPEGPAAQLGGGVSSKIGNLFNLSDSRRRIFTAAGAGAAISAIFNTPLAGVFFALEIILLYDFHTPTFSALILASVTASAISRVFLGNESIFIFESPEIIGYGHLWMYAALGLLAGFISILFLRYSRTLESIIKKKILKVVPQIVLMVLVGGIVGVSGYFYKEIFGIGYSAINEILSSSLSWKVVLVLLGLKFLLVPMILHSGGFGGIFAPSLFMGACFGYIFTLAVNSIWSLNLDPTTFVLVSMGAMLGGINTIPITAIMIIFEMTQNYSFILPLMLAVIISTTIVRLVLKGSVHVRDLEEQGYQIVEGRDTNLLKSILINDVKLDSIELIPEKTPLPEILTKMMESPDNTFFTVDQTGKITGTITDTELRQVITDYENLKSVVIASDLTNRKIVSVSTEDNLDSVLKLFGKWNLDRLPVIDDNGKVIGSISRQEVLSIYNRESLKLNLADGLSEELKTIDEKNPSRVAVGYSIAECRVPNEFIGKSLTELKIRNRFGLEVLMIKPSTEIFQDKEKEEPEIITPDPDYKLKSEDKLVVFGKDEKIQLLLSL
jgi:chloride channel protein, CIC family